MLYDKDWEEFLKWLSIPLLSSDDILKLEIMGVICILIGLLVWAYAHHVLRKSVSVQIEAGKRRMSRREQELYEKSIIADILTEGILNAQVEGTLSNEQGLKWFKRFGNILSISDLLPRGQQVLKDRLKEKLGDRVLAYKGKNIPIPPEILATKPKGVLLNTLKASIAAVKPQTS